MLGSLTHDEIIVEAKRRLGGYGDQAALGYWEIGEEIGSRISGLSIKASGTKHPAAPRLLAQGLRGWARHRQHQGRCTRSKVTGSDIANHCPAVRVAEIADRNDIPLKPRRDIGCYAVPLCAG
jgi:hypothetical protein